MNCAFALHIQYFLHVTVGFFIMALLLLVKIRWWVVACVGIKDKLTQKAVIVTLRVEQQNRPNPNLLSPQNMKARLLFLPCSIIDLQFISVFLLTW